MKTQIISQTDTQAKLSVTLDAAALKPYMEHTFDHLRGSVKASGFRPGKAPNAIVERELGSAAVQGEVMEAAVEATYPEAVVGQKLIAVSAPRITLKKFVPYTELEYEIEVDLLPKVTLGDYKKIRLARPAIKVDPKEIEQSIEDLRRREATRVESKAAAEAGDEVIFDFAGTKGGEPVRGATATDYTLTLGSGQFIPGFEDEMIGLKAGDEKKFKITFPKDYQEESLRGQEVEFAIKLHRVEKLKLPEVDDAFAKLIGPFKNVAELKADLAEQVTTRQAEAATREYENQVLDAVLKASKYTLPPSLVEEQLERLKRELVQNLSYSGLEIEKYLEMSNKTLKELETEMTPEAERRVALALVLTEVAKAEDISVTDSDLDAEMNRLKQQYPDPATQAELDKPETRTEIYNHLMSSRVIAKLIGYAERSAKETGNGRQETA